MEEYPEELRTPPVALVSLVGCPELHASITTHLHSEQPPINALALPDFSKISIFAKPSKDASIPPPPVAGILKKDWLLKHRTRVPAVVAALFNSDHVSGDPAQWLQVCTNLENLKGVLRGRNVKLVVVVVAPSNSKDDLSEDRMIALRKRAELDSKYLIIFVPSESELQQSLIRLGNTFSELANSYYKEEGRRIKALLERKNFHSAELNIRCCFKAAVYAEFCRDWVEALRLYEDAYHAVREMVATSTRLPPIQRLIEIKSVAEQLHFKISTLLLHGGKLAEAIAWFRQHYASYRKLVGAPEVIFLHWQWLSRQFLVFSELLETSSITAQHVSTLVSEATDRTTQWEFHSAYYFQLAAHYLKEKSSSLELALSMSETSGEIDGNADSVIAASYVGQFAKLLEIGDAVIMQSLSDEDYSRYALAEGKRLQDSYEIIALLKKSFEAYNNDKASRMAAYCGFQMAREYFTVDEYSNAKEVFENVANLYRQEGWVTLLWNVLGYLRDCSKKTALVKDFIEYSLEMAALPVSTNVAGQRDCGPAGPASLAQREIIHNEVFSVIRGESESASTEENSSLKVTADNPLYLEIDLVSPLRAVLLASVAFHEQVVKPGAETVITLSLLSQLPLNVEIDQLEIQFNQSECNFVIVNAQRSHLAAISCLQPGRRVETAPTLELRTNKWLRLTYDVKPEQSGKLECIYVTARWGQHFTICCRAESPASMSDLPLWKFEDIMQTIPMKDPGLAFSGQKAVQVEEPDPQVDLKLDSSGPALVGESFIVPVIITSKGHSVHSGELKINLVDTRGGGLLSPREAESFSSDNLHVELVGISGRECEDLANSENIQKIQPSFGLISVPFLDEGESWSCKLEIRWNRPKPIMLYVSLGYFPQSPELSSQRAHVHKSLQIEGKTAVVMSHRFMLPFRREPLLLSKTKPASDSDQIPSLPLNETSMLVVSAKNCTEVPLRLLSMSVEAVDASTCDVKTKSKNPEEHVLLVAGEEFKQVFAVTPEVNLPKLNMGIVCLRWRRDHGDGERLTSCSTTSAVLTKHSLPDVNVEQPPLIVSLDCPPHAILGNPFTYSIKITNRTQFLQEVKYSLADSQSFVLSGPHNDTTFILPKSEHILSYKLVPLASGFQQLPKITLTSVRYSAGFQPSVAASTVFVFPSEPHFGLKDIGEMRMESVAAE